MSSIVLLIALAAPAAPPSDVLDVDLRSNGYDRALFRADSQGTRGRWLLEPDGLQALLPAGPAGRGPISLKGRFRLEGDFEVLADFRIRELPRPHAPRGAGDATAFNALELVVAGPGGWTVVSRKHEKGGPCFSSYADLGGRTIASPCLADGRESGRLGIRRAGETLHFFYAGPDGSHSQIGEVQYGSGPVEEVSIQVHALNTLDGLRVQFDRIVVLADRIIKEGSLRSGWAASVLPAGAAVIAAASLVGIAIRRRAVVRRMGAFGRSGFTLIELLAAIAVIGVLIALLIPAVQSAREAARRASCQNNLRQIGLASANYQATLGVLPFGVGGGSPAGREPRWSAQSQILPYLEQPTLFHSLNFGGIPWSHGDDPYAPLNRTALATTLAGLLCPSDRMRSDEAGADLAAVTGPTSYRGSAGTMPRNLSADLPVANGTGKNDGVFWFQSAVGPADFRDGMSYTALFSERCLGGPGPEDRGSDYYLTDQRPDSCRSISPGTPRFDVTHHRSGGRWGDGNVVYTRYHHILPPQAPSCLVGGSSDYDGPIVSTATSRHSGGVNLLLADGTVRFVKQQVSEPVWKALATVSGGEAFSQDAY
ncbi:DUF1559 family PulG-like putative transporter [Paludisphaera mucosa]|uniref:DUF1559 domain-containing protein n=1 Tax=Paludisphaera mucosa TaxID=3030827 RepID=A0ABT6FEJ9_9BACT|nr:DUF1559 domain-containing protein [Paludisphaera mucosa]MDG3006000.1 DUF1559 domain-containing protein [Paludisphaera mucosa]